jgi:hypothetical protein
MEEAAGIDPEAGPAGEDRPDNAGGDEAANQEVSR